MSPPPLLNGNGDGNGGESYEILGVLGEGAYGTVFSCRSNDSGRLFACKSVDKSRRPDFDYTKEATVMRLLSDHPHILRLHHTLEDDTSFYMFLELCDSMDLSHRITAACRFDQRRAVEVMIQLMEAVSHCHASGVVHRDIKPQNILFDDSESEDGLKLGDFGVAEVCKGRELLRGRAGTPSYMAPEVLDGWSVYNEKADVWSAGVVFYNMLAGTGTTPLFKNGNVQYPSHFSPAVRELLRQMLCKDVAARLSAKEVLVSDLLGVLVVFQSIARIYLDDPSLDFLTPEPDARRLVIPLYIARIYYPIIGVLDPSLDFVTPESPNA